MDGHGLNTTLASKGVEAELGNPLNYSYQTVRDTSGHDKHTMSTAGGRFVSGANLLDPSYGTAKMVDLLVPESLHTGFAGQSTMTLA